MPTTKLKNSSLLTPLSVTNADLTQTDINYSIKIGKQIIKAKLQEQLDALTEQSQEIMIEMNYIFDQKETKALMFKAFKRTINKNTGFTHLRNGFNYFASNPVKNNFKLITEMYSDAAANLIAAPRNCCTKQYKKLVINMSIPIQCLANVGMQIPDNRSLKTETYTEVNSEWNITTPIPNELASKMIKMLKLLENIETNKNARGILSKKLKDIDTTMENMEAKLLTQELNRSNRGKEVLNIASNIISNVISDTVNLAIEVGTDD